MFHVKQQIKISYFLRLAAITEPQANKSFLMQQFFKNAAEVWASSPHLRSKLYLQLVFPAAIAFFETYQLTIWFFLWNKLQIRTRQRGNCSTLAGKSRGVTPFCRTLKIGFSKSIVSRETIEVPVATVPPEQLQDNRLLLRFHKAGRSCSPRLEKLSLFSPPSPCAKRIAREFRCLRAAIRATRPEPRQHFWKIVGSKNFSVACGLS